MFSMDNLSNPDAFFMTNSSMGRALFYMQKQATPIISNEIYLISMNIILGNISQTVTIFGILSNIINCIIFIKQGFSDTVNISLLGLTISDLCSLLCLMFSNLSFTPAFRYDDVPFIADEVHPLVGGWPHVSFTRVTGFITAFISLERCICVMFPLKVKNIFTPRKNTLIVICIFALTLGCSSLTYATAGLCFKFIPERNRTMIGVVYYFDAYSRAIIFIVSYAVNCVLMPMVFFMSVIVFTVILVVKLKAKASWRYSNSSAVGQTNQKSLNVNTKEMKVAKMVVSISIIFIICFIPAVVSFIAGFVEPRLSGEGLYRNLFFITIAVSATTQAINSSTNIFVYYIMSSKYRESFLTLFKIKLSENSNIVFSWCMKCNHERFQH